LYSKFKVLIKNGYKIVKNKRSANFVSVG